MPHKPFSNTDPRILNRIDYARALAGRGEALDAHAIYQSITEDFPDYAPAWFELGNSLGVEGESSLRQYLILDPSDHLGANLHLTRLGKSQSRQPPKAYVAALFDDYANRFEQSLTVKLEYQGPQRLLRLLHEKSFNTALDLGCGTGLMGILLRGQVTHLTGADLSENMIIKSNEKKIYDKLAHSEAIEFLTNSTAKFDLIIAADVFAYFGDLSEIFYAIYAQLNPCGNIAFTVEAGEIDYTIRESLRFAHGEFYIINLLEQTGFGHIKITKEHLRMDQGHSIEAYYICAEKLP